MQRLSTDREVQAAKAELGERLEIRDKLTPGLCLRVTDRGVKTWVLRYRTPDGRQPRLKLGDAKRMTLKAARLEAGRLKAEIDRGADPAGEKRASRQAAAAQTIKTVADLLDAYEQACAAGEWKPKKKRKRPQTIAFERRLMDRHIVPAIGAVKLADASRAIVKAMLRDMTTKGIGAQTNRCHAIVRQAFNFALAEELVASNPAMGFESFHDNEPRRRTWTDTELRTLWEALEATEPLSDKSGTRVYVSRPLRIALQLCVLLLQRRVEVAGMARSEIDLDGATWLIPAERMKAGKPHRVPLPPRAVGLIREAITSATPKEGEAPDPLFPSPRDTAKPVRADSLTHALARLCDAIGIEGATIHDLRRTGSTALTSERIGVAPFIRSQVLGHSSDAGGGASVSFIHYDTNEYLPEKRRALEAWEGLLLEIVGERARPENVTALREGAA